MFSWCKHPAFGNRPFQRVVVEESIRLNALIPLHKLLIGLTTFQRNQCYTGNQLMSVYNVPNSGITLDRFQEICPSLIQQQLSSACKQDGSAHKTQNTDRPSDLERKLRLSFKGNWYIFKGDNSVKTDFASFLEKSLPWKEKKKQ